MARSFAGAQDDKRDAMQGQVRKENSIAKMGNVERFVTFDGQILRLRSG